MATLPLQAAFAAIRSTDGDKPVLKPLKERAVRSGWRHLLFGSGPFWYRCLRFCQRNVR